MELKKFIACSLKDITSTIEDAKKNINPDMHVEMVEFDLLVTTARLSDGSIGIKIFNDNPENNGSYNAASKIKFMVNLAIKKDT